MNLLELDVALRFCESKMEFMLNNQRHMYDKKGIDFKSAGEDREVWVKRKNNIESEIEKIITKNF